ncbi:unnamed protein product [Phyllotreta striolata]|uniref:Ankyrin repeat domain-containing protein 39 n=1 Tax=Phyllotreta striolata TaxID=444603 RepID=A0A9N9TQF4_PHYSR|nr:unnamed protein product [Phyllotreta striolata]
MCDNDSSCKCYKHTAAAQSLEEMDFERGIWSPAQYGDLERVSDVLKKGRDVDVRDSAGYTALHYASRNGHLRVCKFLVENGADVNARTNGGVTALARACSTGKEDIVDFLLSVNADPFIQDSDGKTALHRAALNKHYRICRRLLKAAPNLYELADNKNFKVNPDDFPGNYS